MFDFSAFLVRPVVLRCYTLETALGRLIDFDLIQAGEPPQLNPSWETMDRSQARRLYSEGLCAFMAEFVTMADADLPINAAKIFAYVSRRGEIQGVESIFLTALGILESRGPALAKHASQARQRLAGLPKLARISGGDEFGLFFRTFDRCLLALPKDGIMQMLKPDGGDLVRGSRRVDELATSKYETVASSSVTCPAYVTAVAATASALIGKTYGADIGGTAGVVVGLAGGPAVAAGLGMAGAALGTWGGAQFGGLAATVVAIATRDLFCGGQDGGQPPAAGTGDAPPVPASGTGTAPTVPASGPPSGTTPSGGTAPATGVPNAAPAPAPKGSLDSDTPPRTTTGGKDDDPPPDKESNDGPTMVACELPDDGGGGSDPYDPSDTPGQVVHPISFVRLPKRYIVDTVLDEHDPAIGRFGEFPRFQRFGNEEVVEWGDFGHLKKDEITMLFVNGATGSEQRIPQKRLWEEIINPVRPDWKRRGGT